MSKETSTKKKGTKKRKDLYQEVTDTIIKQIESGTKPWLKPWSSDKAIHSGPVNGVSGHKYKGINALMLFCNPKVVETGDPRYLTFKQAKEKGWSIKKGEKASTVYFFKRVEVEPENGEPAVDENGEVKTKAFLRSYAVFHASQVDGIPEYEAKPKEDNETDWSEPAAIKTLLENSGANVRIGGDKAFYNPSTDHIQLPPTEAFKSPESWSATSTHELAHWTAHEDRLNRNLDDRFGTPGYALEELRAELASAFICSELGISPELENHASYLDGWLTVLKNDKFEIFRAAGDAQKAADFCLEFIPEQTLEDTADLEDMPEHVRKAVCKDNPTPVNPPFDMEDTAEQVASFAMGGPSL
ncbi:DNA primase TraC (fragment) [Candidatus Terasakiella magnetica]|uniref:DNA primase TraC n=1 Tax=Candidatus Terasakiella magnetica TaxID=1867952 RepID=A0A1C3RFF0_9PROT